MAKSEPSASPPAKSWWAQAKAWWTALWWARGIVSAFAVAGVLAAIPGFNSVKVFDLVHAVTELWTGILLAGFRWVADLLEVRIYATADDMILLAIVFALIFPAYIAGGIKALRMQWRPHLLATIGGAPFLIFMCWAIFFWPREERAFVPLDQILISSLILILSVAAFILLWVSARTVAVAFAFTLTFILTLSAFHYVPNADKIFDSWIAELRRVSADLN